MAVILPRAAHAAACLTPILAIGACASTPCSNVKATANTSRNIVDTAKLAKSSLAACRDGGAGSADSCDEVEQELDLIIANGTALQDSAGDAGGKTK